MKAPPLVEFESLGKIPSSPEFSASQGYDLMAVPRLDGKTRIWIVLWPKSPPFYKWPGGNFEIPRDLRLKLEANRKVSSTLASALDSHVPSDN
jgi:hypothetical protein